MPTSIDRGEVVRLGEHERAQVIEVLPRGEYDWAHLEGAAHLWLGDMDAEQVKLTLDPDRPVVVYGHDFQ
jgi:rhodanese-related sulfurtransferase